MGEGGGVAHVFYFFYWGKPAITHWLYIPSLLILWFLRGIVIDRGKLMWFVKNITLIITFNYTIGLIIRLRLFSFQQSHPRLWAYTH